MALYLRFSLNIQEDIERGHSFHMTGFGKELYSSPEEAGESLEITNVEYIEDLRMYAEVLDGLCAFDLGAETLEDAIEEAKTLHRDAYDAKACPAWHILEADYCGDCPEGDLIDNITLLYSNPIPEDW